MIQIPSRLMFLKYNLAYKGLESIPPTFAASTLNIKTQYAEWSYFLPLPLGSM